MPTNALQIGPEMHAGSKYSTHLIPYRKYQCLGKAQIPLGSSRRDALSIHEF